MIMPSAMMAGRPWDRAYASSVWMLEPTCASSPLAADSMALSYHSMRSGVIRRTGPVISAPTVNSRGARVAGLTVSPAPDGPHGPRPKALPART